MKYHFYFGISAAPDQRQAKILARSLAQPRILGAEAEFGTDALVHEFRQPFRTLGIHAVPVQIFLIHVTAEQVAEIDTILGR